MKPRTSGSSSITSTDARARSRSVGRSAASIGQVGGCGLLFGQPEQQLDRGPDPRLAVDPRDAARLPRHAIDHRQPKTGALADLLGGEERLERARRDLSFMPPPVSVIDSSI